MTDEPRSSKRFDTIALLLAALASILAIIAIISASRAQQKADTATQKAINAENITHEVVKSSGDKASSGGGVGQNVPTQPQNPNTGNTMPNASGQ